MEILKRKIEAKREEFNSTKDKETIMHSSLIDGERLSCRWAEKRKLPNAEELEKAKSFEELKKKLEEEDLVINFTKEETEKIRKTIGRRDC